MARNSIIILCKNIKIDRNYQNCLTLSESDMVTLCRAKKIVEGNNFSFIRDEENSIVVPYSYANCLVANYIAFQNSRYSNKWFFAFVDSVNYVSDGATRINFTVDVFSTWWSYWDPATCFVIREHVNDDTPYTNLVDEGLSVGEYVMHDQYDLALFNKANFQPVLGVSEIIESGSSDIKPPLYSEQGDVFSGVCYITPSGNQNVFANTSTIVRAYDDAGKRDAIQFIFMCPLELITNSTYSYGGTIGTDTYQYNVIDNSAFYHKDFSGIKPTTIEGYTPVNKKLLQYPYCYVSVDPHSGGMYNYHYEDFYSDDFKFSCDAILSPSCSVKISPKTYKDSGSGENNTYGLTGVKFPMCSWNSDAYTNWLTQNGINLGFTTLKKDDAVGLASLGSMMLGATLIASGVGAGMGAGLIGTGVTGMFSAMQSDYKASLIPDQIKGNENSGDINFAIGLVNPTINKMCIKREIAVTIDDFFTRYGYKVNRLKTPNQTGRTYFNFVQIGDSEIIGYPKANLGVPADAMEMINSIYRKGVTLWHNHDRIGNYDGNTIVNPPTTPTIPPTV